MARELAAQKSTKCARKSCINEHMNCQHTQDGRLYCRPCAFKINRANPETPNLVLVPPRGTPLPPTKPLDGKHERECWDCKTINLHEDSITPWVLCPHCGSQDTRRITPKEIHRPPQQAESSSEGLKVGDEVTPAQAEPVVDNEVWDCDCGVVNDWIEETCIVCESPRPKLSPQPVEAQEPWKPINGERVLVEAEVVKRYKDDTVMVACDSNVIKVPLSLLRPLPVVQGENLE